VASKQTDEESMHQTPVYIARASASCDVPPPYVSASSDTHSTYAQRDGQAE